MKRICFSAAVLFGTAFSTMAQDFVAPLPRAPEVRPPAVAPPAGVDGALARGVRSGNPLQMINPFAPREYGTGGDLIYYEQADPFQRPPQRGTRAVGIKLVTVEY